MSLVVSIPNKKVVETATIAAEMFPNKQRSSQTVHCQESPMALLWLQQVTQTAGRWITLLVVKYSNHDERNGAGVPWKQ